MKQWIISVHPPYVSLMQSVLGDIKAFLGQAIEAWLMHKVPNKQGKHE